ncbi:hypothetical protein BGX23_010038 [Mortierella sp. AD031]|nr:hypothetical protein BGX23_010038 [Mortierella sp. AD031]
MDTTNPFFDKFGILEREDGHRRYARALRQSDMSKHERTLLTNKFEAWKSSESTIYWERRNTKAVAKKSAWRTAANLIRVSEPFVDTIIAENAKEQRQHSPVPSDTPPNLGTPILTPNTKTESKDHAKRTRTAMTRNLPKKRVRLRDPWHDLADIAVRLFKRNAIDLPPEETKDTEKDPEHKKLYGLAWRHLKDAKVALEQQDADKEMCLHFRDAFVALSGVFNLYSPMTRKALSSADCLEAKRLCLIPELEYKDEELTKLLDALKTTKTRKLTVVLEDVYSIENILNPHHGDNKPSDGEQASRATRASKSKLACALNTGYGARKCDCTLSIGKIQFGNGEAKRASTLPVAVKIQLRKNIKIARSVMLELSKYGLACPPQLSLHGFQADVFRVVPWKGVYVAASACDPIVLPTTEAPWNPFIENTAHHLKNLLEYYHEYAVDAKEKIDIFNYTRNTVGQEEEGEGEGEEGKEVENESDLEGKESEIEGGLDEEIELIDWSDVIFHTPTKPRATRTMAVMNKPNNQRFQQRLQEAMAEHEYDDEDDEDDKYDDDGE